MNQQITLPRLMNREQVVSRLSRTLLALPLEKAWSVEVKEHKPKRSGKQNAMLWAIYGQILTKGGEAMGGWVKEDLHQFFLIDHFGGDRKALFGKARIVPKTGSSRLNKQEFTDFVDHIVRFMADQGVFIDLPSDGQ